MRHTVNSFRHESVVLVSVHGVPRHNPGNVFHTVFVVDRDRRVPVLERHGITPRGPVGVFAPSIAAAVAGSPTPSSAFPIVNHTLVVVRQRGVRLGNPTEHLFRLDLVVRIFVRMPFVRQSPERFLNVGFRRGFRHSQHRVMVLGHGWFVVPTTSALSASTLRTTDIGRQASSNNNEKKKTRPTTCRSRLIVTEFRSYGSRRCPETSSRVSTNTLNSGNGGNGTKWSNARAKTDRAE